MAGADIKLVEWFDDRYYKVTIDGVDHFFPSVTTIDEAINKPFLNKWRGAVGNLNADIAMAIAIKQGKRVHEAIEQLLRGETITWGETTLTQGEYWRASIALEMLQVLKPRVLGIEQIVAHLGYRYAGTIDVLAEIMPGTYAINGSKPLKLEGGKYVLDWKTGTQISDSAYRQMAAYVEALESSGVENLQGALVVHLGSKTRSGIEGLSVHSLDRAQLAKHFEDFLAVKSVWERLNPNASPKVRELPTVLKYETNGETDK